MAGDSTYTYDAGAMREAADRLLKANTDIVAQLDAMEEYAKQNMLDWTQSSKDEYDRHKKAWDLAAVDMCNVLGGKAKPAILNTLDLFEQTDKQIQKSFML